MPVELWHITPMGQVRRCKVNVEGARENRMFRNAPELKADGISPFADYLCALSRKKATRIRDSMIQDYRFWRGPRKTPKRRGR